MDDIRLLTTEQIIAILEEDNDYSSASIFIMPPEDGCISAEDSGDEDSGGTLNNLPGSQLRSEGEALITRFSETERLTSVTELESNIGSEHRDECIQENTLSTRVCSQRKKEQRKWEKIDINPEFRNFNITSDISAVPNDPVSCFELFFDDEIWDFLTKMFVLYVQQKGDYTFTLSSEEVKCFVGVLILSGYNIVPRWRMFWETDSETYNEAVSSAMRRNRFELIKKYAHCADNNDLKQNDRYAKLTPLISLLNKRYAKYCIYEEHLAVDESMVRYYGRHGAKQFIRGKPIRYGYKMWCLCDRLGYLINFNPYSGKDESRPKEMSLGEHVVLQLIHCLPKGNSFKIYGDRLFSSLSLASNLANLGFGYTGTINKNRTEKCPLEETKILEKKGRGTFDYRADKNTNCLILEWHDNRIVHMISTCDSVHPLKTANRWVSSEKKKVPIVQPNTVGQYNKFMGGVDRMDENLECYRIGIRSKKWWWPVFMFCIDTAIHNGWQIFRKTEHGQKVDHLSFRRSIVQNYLQKYKTLPSSGGRPKSSKSLISRTIASVRFDGSGHWMSPATKQGRCAMCKKNTTKQCEKCHIKLHENCFKLFHTPN